MIFVTGPLYSGKKEYIKNKLNLTEEEFEGLAVCDVQELAAGKNEAELEILAEKLSNKTVVIATETGGGVVPSDKKERENREAAGRLSVLLAERADTVIRVICGIGKTIKGKEE